MAIGVAVVSYRAGDALIDCLESLLAAAPGEDGARPDLRVVVVDNASPDDTVERLRAWARGGAGWDGAGKPFAPRPPGPVTLAEHAAPGELAAAGLPSATDPAAGAPPAVGLVHAGRNGGFAAGVNLGLAALGALDEVEAFWILNPDAMVENATPAALERAVRGAGVFGILGGRTYYTDPPLMVQTDGGQIDLWTGRLLPVNLGRQGRDVPGPAPDALDYVPGCHMVISRDFVERAGPMPEDYFLYYEEIDWCLRRGDLPILYSDAIPIHHYSGASIGSAKATAGPSPLSAYYMSRSRLRFVRRWRPTALPVAWLYTLGKAGQMAMRGQRAAAGAALRAVVGLPWRA